MPPCRKWLLVFVVLAASAAGQPSQPDLPTQPVASQRLERALKIVTDTQASDEVRRIGAEDLLRLEEPGVSETAARILEGTDSGAQVALCNALGAIGGDLPEARWLPLVKPLIELLSSDQSDLATKAGVALSVIPDPQVPPRLGELAADPALPLSTRLAAVEALARSAHRRDTIDQLVRLVELGTAPEIRQRAIAALRQVSTTDYGEDVGQWVNWWQSKRRLDEGQWDHERADAYWRRIRELTDSLEETVSQAISHQRTLSHRLTEQIEATYRLTPQGQRDELLLRWLDDPLLEYRNAALGMLAKSISEGNRPASAIRASLRQLLAQEAPDDIKRQVLDLIAALNDPADAEAVLGQLEVERSPTVREALLRTVGRLQNPAAIHALTAELQNPQASEPCLIAAIGSLGLLGMKSKVDLSVVTPLIQPILERYAATSPESLKLRAAFLTAMANIGSPEFGDVFVANMEASSIDILLPALQGIAVVGADVSMETLLALVEHDDPRVRRRAMEALGALAGEPTHPADVETLTTYLETLVDRLAPSAEPNEAVRDAAWLSFERILSRLPVSDQLAWADRLQGLPERREAVLRSMAGDLTSPHALESVELAEARIRLASLLDSQQRWTEALPIWEQLQTWFRAAQDDRARLAGRRVLQGTLELRQYERIDPMIQAWVAAADAAEIQQVADQLLDHLRSRADTGDTQGLDLFREAVRRLPPDLLGAEFLPSFDELFTRVHAVPAPSPQAPPAETTQPTQTGT